MDNQKKATSSTSDVFRIRKATVEDIVSLQALIDLSVRGLHPPFYSPTVIDLALAQLTAIDTNHVNDGNYFIAETEPSHSSSSSLTPSTLIVGMGGWSHRATLYGNNVDTSSDPVLLDPGKDAAKLRALFVHPAWAKNGIASMLLKACEDAAREMGFGEMELRGSLQAVAFYERRGYGKVETVDRPLGGGEVLALVMMRKKLV